MRLAVLSDIHGNLPALEAVLQEVRRPTVDGILVAGDLVGGPQANETIALLAEIKADMIRGNSDINLLRYGRGDAPPPWRTARQFALLRWAHRNLGRPNLEYLRGLPEERVVDAGQASLVRLVHGSPGDSFEGLDPRQEPEALRSALERVREPVLVCGHTHLSWKVELDGKLALNPGAVCGPLNGDPRAQYAILTWQGGRWHAEHHAVAVDHARIRQAFAESGLLEEGGALARAFLLSIETAVNVGELFFSHAYRRAAAAGCEDSEVVPDDIWEEAEATFNWQEYERHAP